MVEEVPEFEGHGLGLPVSSPRLHCFLVPRGGASLQSPIAEFKSSCFSRDAVIGTGSDLFFQDLPATPLSPALTRTLQGYERLFGCHDQVYDLTQAHGKRPRTLLIDGLFPVVTCCI